MSDVSSQAIEATGASIVDDYGAFFTVQATPEQASAMKDAGATVERLSRDLHRGQADIADVSSTSSSATEASRHVVQFRGPVKSEWREFLTDNSLAVYDYIPQNAYLVRLSESQRLILLDFEPIERILPYPPIHKVSTRLPTEGPTRIAMYSYSDADPSSVIEGVQQLGGTVEAHVRTSLDSIVYATVLAESIAQLANLNGVSWIELAPNSGALSLDKSSAYVQSGQEGLYGIHARGVDGSTQVGVACDTGIWTTRNATYSDKIVIKPMHEVSLDTHGTEVEYNAYLSANPEPWNHSKVVSYYSPQEPPGQARGDWNDESGQTDHGLRVMSILAGNKGNDSTRDEFDGVAYRSRIAVCDVEDSNGTFHYLNNIWLNWEPGYNASARVASFSAGVIPRTDLYNDRSRQYDEIVWERRNFTIVQAMGNIADVPPRAEECVRTMAPEAVAKNAVSVGGTHNKQAQIIHPDDGDNPDNMSIGSCQGPTADGRIKPNVVAPGFCVKAAKRSGYGCLGGTSFATPAVAGAALLIRDYFAKGFYPSGTATSGHERLNTSAALIRAMLQVSAKEIPGDFGDPTFPNGVQGWGRVLLEKVLYFNGDTDRLLVLDESETNNLTTGGQWTREFIVNSNQPVRGMIAWTDYPGTLGASIPLVNNLNLRVGGPPLTPGGVNATYIGNKFVPVSPLNTRVTSETPAGHFPADSFNVEEAVYVCNNDIITNTCNVIPGTYVVRVIGANVPRAEGQNFAVVIVGDVSWA